jgi:Tol biopolymer transport system component
VPAEAQNNQVVFSSFAPLQGRSAELVRVEVDPATITFWDLSPDGSRIAFGVKDEHRGEIRILPLAGGPERTVHLKDAKNLQSVAWTADGAALFVTNWASEGYSLWRVNLTGQMRLLRKAGIWLERPVPSPDGRYLAFAEGTASSNAWMLEKFR